jgi:hypothetical protein
MNNHVAEPFRSILNKFWEHGIDHDMSETGPDTYYREQAARQILLDLEAGRKRQEELTDNGKGAL